MKRGCPLWVLYIFLFLVSLFDSISFCLFGCLNFAEAGGEGMRDQGARKDSKLERMTFSKTKRSV